MPQLGQRRITKFETELCYFVLPQWVPVVLTVTVPVAREFVSVSDAGGSQAERSLIPMFHCFCLSSVKWSVHNGQSLEHCLTRKICE